MPLLSKNPRFKGYVQYSMHEGRCSVCNKLFRFKKESRRDPDKLECKEHEMNKLQIAKRFLAAVLSNNTVEIDRELLEDLIAPRKLTDLEYVELCAIIGALADRQLQKWRGQ